jgi:hypothetical protein
MRPEIVNTSEEQKVSGRQLEASGRATWKTSKGIQQQPEDNCGYCHEFA